MITLCILIAIIFVFIVLPNAVDLFGFSGAKFFGGELWRILSYPYAHVSTMHLVENAIGFGVILLLGFEFEFKIKEFIWVFFGAGILIALEQNLQPTIGA